MLSDASSVNSKYVMQNVDIGLYATFVSYYSQI